MTPERADVKSPVDFDAVCIYRSRMPPKKPKKTVTERHPVTLRFNDVEMAGVKADQRDIVNGGVPVSVGAYAKHAVLSYARLRRLEANLRSHIGDMFCGQMITEATIRSLTEAR